MTFVLLSDSDSDGESNREDEGEFFINMHVGGHLVRDPDLRYNEGTMLRFPEDPETISFFELEKIVKNGLVYNSVDRIYFYRPGSRSFNEGLRLVWDNSSTIDMLNVWRKYKEVDLYVEHKFDVPTVLEESEGSDGKKNSVQVDMNEVEGDRAKVDNERVVVEEVRVELERGAEGVEGYEGIDMNKVEGDRAKVDNERVVVEEVKVEVERGAEGVEGYEGVDMNEVEGDRAKVDNEKVVVEEVRVRLIEVLRV
ncbi:hypothetical protein PTKIN_Ptkin08bG0121700 [Pterospermum kingtungense]